MSFGSNKSYGSTNPRYSAGLSYSEMFPPGNSDFYQECDGVSSDIFVVSNSVTTLERALKQIGSSNDSLALRDKIHEIQHVTNGTIGTTTKTLKSLTVSVRNGDRQQKLHLERLRNEFQETVKRYSTSQKNVAEKIKLHYLSAKSRADTAGIGWSDTVEDENNDQHSLLEQEQKRTQVQALQQEIEVDTALIAERESRIRQIETDMLDVNQIFRDLGTMVQEQGEVVNSIEANVEKAAQEVDAGRDQLQKASHYQKSYRKKLCIFVVIILIVTGVVAIIVVTSLPKKK